MPKPDNNTWTAIALVLFTAVGFTIAHFNFSDGINKYETPSMYADSKNITHGFNAGREFNEEAIQAYIYEANTNTDWWGDRKGGKAQISGTKPFKDLSSNDVAYATAVIAPNAAVALTGDQIKELVILLNRVTVYNQDNSYAEGIGSSVMFTLLKADGTQDEVAALNPSIIINGVGYRAEYWPCEELSNFGYSLTY